ncbi:hypothetical protein [Erythrobacter sp. HKB08]|uniref:hypothetical protein n=1 Tax=Erythrobacter sp. HKB08 TaxID=2502843 RepID=UPI0010090B77|nr:hypothetical protein [Erythrobacter sp. HKB08]
MTTWRALALAGLPGMLAFAAPASAQDEEVPETDVPEAEAAEPVELTDEELAALPPSGPSLVAIDGSPWGKSLYPRGFTLPETAIVCLEDAGDFVVFGRKRESADEKPEALLFSGEGCMAAPPRGGEEPAEEPEEETLPPIPEAIAFDPDELIIAASTGPDAPRFPAGTKIVAATRICLEEGSRVSLFTGAIVRTIEGAECQIAGIRGVSTRSAFANLTSKNRRVRTGSVRSASTSPRETYMIVIRGSEVARRFYPLGSRVRTGGRICLPPSSGFLTFQREEGGTLTYGEDGCNRAIAEPAASDQSAGAGSGP